MKINKILILNINSLKCMKTDTHQLQENNDTEIDNEIINIYDTISNMCKDKDDNYIIEMDNSKFNQNIYDNLSHNIKKNLQTLIDKLTLRTTKPNIRHLIEINLYQLINKLNDIQSKTQQNESIQQQKLLVLTKQNESIQQQENKNTQIVEDTTLKTEVV